MTLYSNDELERMLADLESDRVERKESWNGDAPDKSREAICAFANDLPDHKRSGVLFVGAKDNGTPSGIAVTDELLRKLADMKTDANVVPPPSLFVEKRRLAGADIAVVTVEPADSPPVRCRGRIHVRFGPRRGIATAQDERILNEKRRHGDRPFDLHAVREATLADLSRRTFDDEYLPAAFAADVLASNDRSLEQRLAATKMIVGVDDPTPTVLGVLVLGVRTRDFLPGAYIQFLRFAGNELSDAIVDEQVCDGMITEVLRKTEDKLRSHMRTAVDLTTSSKEHRTSPYPFAALEQYVRNAVLHRTYESTNAPVKVLWFDDRIEIHSPGGSFGTVTPANFGAPGLAEYRNPNLAEALKVLGYVQRFGVGMATARNALRENGNPVAQYLVEPTRIAIVVKAAR